MYNYIFFPVGVFVHCVLFKHEFMGRFVHWSQKSAAVLKHLKDVKPSIPPPPWKTHRLVDLKPRLPSLSGQHGQFDFPSSFCVKPEASRGSERKKNGRALWRFLSHLTRQRYHVVADQPITRELFNWRFAQWSAKQWRWPMNRICFCLFFFLTLFTSCSLWRWVISFLGKNKPDL